MSTCILVCAASPSNSKTLELVHVTETLHYRFENESEHVLLRFDLIVNNSSDLAAGLVLVHRAGVERAKLLQFFDESARFSIRKLYNDRIRLNGNVVEFHPRRNCVGFHPIHIEIRSAFPDDGSRLEVEKSRDLVPSEEYGLSLPPFTRFEIGQIPAKSSLAFGVEMKISGASFRHLVGDNCEFSIDGTSRILQDIAYGDLYELDGAEHYRRIFTEFVEPCVLTPQTYDLVVPVEDGSPVRVSFEGERSQIVEFPKDSLEPEFAKSVHWFATQSPDFYLMGKYDSLLVAH